MDISSATAWVGTDILKALAIPSDRTAKRPAVHWEDLKPYWKSEKIQISRVYKQAYYLQAFQILS